MSIANGTHRVLTISVRPTAIPSTTCARSNALVRGSWSTAGSCNIRHTEVGVQIRIETTQNVSSLRASS